VELAVAAARAASERKAQEIIALDVSEQLVLTDVFLIASGTNERQVAAIVDAVEEAMFVAGAKPIRREGKSQARWVLLEFGAVVASRASAERKAHDTIENNVRVQLVLTDVFHIASGTNERQVAAIVDAVEEAMFVAGAKPIRREGKSQARWVLLDFGEVVVHV